MRIPLAPIVLLSVAWLSACAKPGASSTEGRTASAPATGAATASHPSGEGKMPASRKPASPEAAMSDPLAPFADLKEDADGHVRLADAEWRRRLSPPVYKILRQGGTEWAGTGALLDETRPGTYHCAGCGSALYRSTGKFQSHCGWPAFDEEIAGRVRRLEDLSHGMRRVEIRCERCDGHLGHVFEGEGYTAKDVRHCVNSASLLFVPEKK